jgi:hypothetical protein
LDSKRGLENEKKASVLEQARLALGQFADEREALREKKQSANRKAEQVRIRRGREGMEGEGGREGGRESTGRVVGRAARRRHHTAWPPSFPPSLPPSPPPSLPTSSFVPQVKLEKLEAELEAENPWERVISLIDMQADVGEAGAATSDMQRLKQILIQLKSEPLEGKK